MAYQSSPLKANHLTISEACFKEGKWQGDRSQNFFIETEALQVDYLEVLGIQKKPNKWKDTSSFTVYLACEEFYFYRAEF